MQQGLVQQQTEQADLLTWRAEQQQQELITQLSAAASSVNEPIQLTKLQQVGFSALGKDSGTMGIDCCAVTAVWVLR
jgi:hypothetical protein